MRTLISSSDRQGQWGMLMLRLALGVVMFLAGWMKLVDFGPANFGKALATMGVPLPELFGYAVTLLEVVGGAFVVIGLLSRPVAVLLIIDMVVAIVLVTSKVGFLSPTGKSGAEINVLLIEGFLAILFAGAGSISVDRVLERRARER